MDWSKREVELIVADYFSMLQKELSHVKYNKTEYRLALLPLLQNRSNGSVEFKHQNISAVLAKMGSPYIKGYKPRPNFQELLEEEVIQYIRAHNLSLEKQFQQFADERVDLPSNQVRSYESMVGEEPEQTEAKEPKSIYRRPVKKNYLEQEQNNRFLGEQGEQLVLDYERNRLIEAGRKNLVDKIEWTSKKRGDGLGYDILSKNTDGTDKFIEVKTTKLPNTTPFYVTKLELAFAAENPDSFYLYRVYNFGTNSQFFIKQGRYEDFCRLEPITFKGSF